jgi:ABC-type sugar transport system permease subunit
MPRRTLNAWLYLAFPMAILTIFTLIPTGAGLALSLFDWDGSGLPRFVAGRNYTALARDPRFPPALVNTLVFVVGTVPAATGLGFLLAVAVHARWFRAKPAARTLLFMPTMVSIIAVGFVWRWVLEDKGGLLPAMIRGLGIDPPDFLQGGPVFSFTWTDHSGGFHSAHYGAWLTWPLLSIMAVQVWRTVGFSMVLYLSALSSVSESLYEAAEVDGASRVQVMRRVTWPLVRPMTAFLLVTGAIAGLQVFDIVWAITVTAETDATNVLNLYVYREFQQSRLGYAAAIGAVIFGLTIAATAGQLLSTRRTRGAVA